MINECAMTDEQLARMAHAAYQREWRRKNPEKARAAVQRCLAKKGRKMLEEMMASKERAAVV